MLPKHIVEDQRLINPYERGDGTIVAGIAGANYMLVYHLQPEDLTAQIERHIANYRQSVREARAAYAEMVVGIIAEGRGTERTPAILARLVS